MFTWPHLELTEYERRFVRLYKTDKYPGVLRRAYELILNTLQTNPLNPDPQKEKLEAQIQITRRSRIFGLSFSGDTSQWRLNIETASGERFTPKLPQADGDPLVTSMVPGSAWNGLAAVGGPYINAGVASGGELNTNLGQYAMGPLLIEPNWELVANETLIFRGTPIAVGESIPENLLLCITVHVWEFPGMVLYSAGKIKDKARRGTGPTL